MTARRSAVGRASDWRSRRSRCPGRCRRRASIRNTRASGAGDRRPHRPRGSRAAGEIRWDAFRKGRSPPGRAGRAIPGRAGRRSVRSPGHFGRTARRPARRARELVAVGRVFRRQLGFRVRLGSPNLSGRREPGRKDRATDVPSPGPAGLKVSLTRTPRAAIEHGQG